jgi:cell division protease FtsH
MKSGSNRTIFVYVLIIIATIVVFTFLLPPSIEPTEKTIDEVVTLSQENQIRSITIEGDVLNVITIDGSEYITYKEPYTTIYDIEGLNLEGIALDVLPASGWDWGAVFINFLPIILIGALLFFFFSQARGANNKQMSFGRSKAKMFSANTPSVTFNDVAGVEEAKQEVVEVVEFLKHREKFQALGARIPRGMLLVGPPGTGKTLLARAIAGEAGVPFFSISGSEFVEMFVGVGASRVRDLFEQAKRNAPCIIFIDEIDAVGRSRGAGLGGSHDEREQTLNQILVEMDGFDTSTSVIVLAATNRPDILDQALLRPGRFDRRIILDNPDINGRIAILKIHSKGKPLSSGVKFEGIARQTVGFSGADLANLVNEAAILAARVNRKTITSKDFEESIDRVIAGPERKSRRINEKERSITAYHEVGHGLIAHTLPNADPVHKMSIVARGMSLGHTRQLPAEDRYLMTRSQFKDTLATLLGGQVAEELIFNEISTGASDDIRRATELAHKMVTQYGMSEELGPRTFGKREEMIFLGREISEQRNYGDKIANQIDEEVHRIIDNAHQVAKKILSGNTARLEMIAQKLMVKETLEEKELERLFNGPIKKASSKKRVSKTKAKKETVKGDQPKKTG